MEQDIEAPGAKKVVWGESKQMASNEVIRAGLNEIETEEHIDISESYQLVHHWNKVNIMVKSIVIF